LDSSGKYILCDNCAVALIMLRGILKDCGEPKDVEVDKIVSRRALLKKNNVGIKMKTIRTQ